MNHINHFFAPLLLSFALITSLAAETFEAGVEAYHASEYDAAVEYFEHAIQSGENASLRHNLALSYFQDGELGEATWQLERAIRIEPLNASYQFKLGALRQQLGLYGGSADWWQPVSTAISPNIWITIATLSFWLLAALILIPRKGQQRLLTKLALTTAAVCMSLSIAALIIQNITLPSGVITKNESVTLRHAPADGAPEAGIARPGERLKVTDEYGDYLKVETEAEITGWLHSDTYRAL